VWSRLVSEEYSLDNVSLECPDFVSDENVERISPDGGRESSRDVHGADAFLVAFAVRGVDCECTMAILRSVHAKWRCAQEIVA
jgi:hypothetical protein